MLFRSRQLTQPPQPSAYPEVNAANVDNGHTYLEIAVGATNAYVHADAAIDGHRSALDALPKDRYLHLDHVRKSDAAYDKVHGPRCNECKLHFGFNVLVECPECADEYCPKCVRYLRHWPCTEDNKGAGQLRGVQDQVSTLRHRGVRRVRDDALPQVPHSALYRVQ